jgi:hypothetical protein
MMHRNMNTSENESDKEKTMENHIQYDSILFNHIETLIPVQLYDQILVI